MKLLGTIDPTLPLVVVAVDLEAQELHTSLPVLVTGVGKVTSGQALLATLGPLHPSQRPTTVLNVGTAGALVDGLDGTQVIGRVLQHDLDGVAIEALVGHNPAPDIVLGEGLTLATGDRFIATQSERQELARRAQLVDMEGYAVAKAARVLGVEVRLVKQVSDNANEAASLTWVQRVTECSHQLGAWLQAQGY
jgi:adenosylhomocysteine nucleosidase